MGKDADKEFAEARRRMVRDQLQGPGRDITNTAVLGAMERVPRHLFMPRPVWGSAYNDHPVPIGYDQTISQPYIVAYMTEKLDPKPHERILEVGTGSGYQAAILGELAREVYTIEIVEPLGQRAAMLLQEQGRTNIFTKIGDGHLGWPEKAPFDAIIVTCAPESVPQPLVDQLREGGRMVIPVGNPATGQTLFVLHKQKGVLVEKDRLPVRFVPMTRRSSP